MGSSGGVGELLGALFACALHDKPAVGRVIAEGVKRQARGLDLDVVDFSLSPHLRRVQLRAQCLSSSLTTGFE